MTYEEGLKLSDELYSSEFVEYRSGQIEPLFDLDKLFHTYIRDEIYQKREVAGKSEKGERIEETVIDTPKHNTGKFCVIL